jgi:hypothetical protein
MAEFDRRAAEAWFRRCGLPLFVHRDERGSRLRQRAVPALVFVLVLDPVVSLVTWFLDVAAVVVPVVAGWLASLRMRAL